MPKRILTHHMAKAAKVRRKSMFLDDPSQLLENPEDETNTEAHIPKTKKNLHYIPSNKSNELERLLMYTSKSLIYHVDHSDFPAFNVGMWPQKNCDMLTNYPTSSFSVPRPLFIANQQCERVDICYKRPMNRHFFKTRMKKTRTAYQTALKSNKNIRSSVKDNIYHYSVFEMAERAYMQPDPFFQSSYDCYFTGGNLAVLPIGKIIHSGGENLQEMLLSEFSAVGEHTKSDCLLNVDSFKNSEDCEIFEYCPVVTSLDSNRQNCFIARQRNLITFNYITNANQIKTVTKFRTRSTPFISFAQSIHDINNFVITTMKQDVRVYDLSGSAPALVKLFEISKNAKDVSWNTVKPWRENTFMYANEKQFFMIDVRTTPNQWLNEVSFSNNDLMCDHISAVLPSDFKNIFYVATNHKLQCLDVRYLKKNCFSDSNGGVCRWTHQLRYAPLMMDTFRLRQTEYIALSSPLAGDLHICQLSRERNDDNISLDSSAQAHKHIYSSHCLPYQPPTLLEAYEHARLSGKCLRPEANLEARIKCCTTGMKFFKPSIFSSDSGVGLLITSNSNGDIFAHTLSKREDNVTEERCNKQSDEIMAAFERKICHPHPLNYTGIKNMKGLRKAFLCQPLSSVKKFDFNEMSNEYYEDALAANNSKKTAGKSNQKRLYLGRWQKSVATLHSCKDALADSLLSIWDIDIEEDNKLHLDDLRHTIKPDPAVKVDKWLQQNVNADPPMLSIPQQLLKDCDNNASNVFDTSLSLSQTQNTIDFDNAVHSTQILQDSVNVARNLNTSDMVIQINDGSTATVIDKLKNSKKKPKKYVKGF